MADIVPPNRLVRKRNSNLQKRLDVTLQILGQEYRQTKERMYKEERDCGKFLQSLHSTVPGLHAYGQPNTRAMNRNAILRERRFSLSVSVHSESDDEDLHNPLATRPRSSSKHDDHHRAKPGISEGNRVSSAAEGSGGGGGGGGSRQTAVNDRNSLAKKLRENNTFLNRPSTSAGGGQKTGEAKAPERDGKADRASSARHLRHQRPRHSPQYGKNAYSEHERFVQEKVLKRFDVIFDPETEAPKVNLCTLVAPSVVVGGNDDDDDDVGDDATGTAANTGLVHPQVNVVNVNGKEFHLSRTPPGHRRVMWSAQPHRKQRAASAPNSAKKQRPASAIPSTSTTTTSRPASTALQSASLTAMTTRTKSPTESPPPPPPPHPSHHSAKPDSRIQFLSLQKNLPAQSCWEEEGLSESSSESDMDEQTQDTAKPNPKKPQEPQALSKPTERSMNQPCTQQRRQVQQANTKNQCAAQHSQQREQSPTKHDSATKLLQVQAGSHHHHHHHPNPPPDGSGAQLNVPPQKAGRKNSITRPSSRLSDASDRAGPPVELWTKLMKSGLPGRTSKRPKTAPAKSELSHRFMPASRQTVVGILAQIENQKVHTRNMINESKELHKSVKKLVPWDYQTSLCDLDDW
ncbi:uncharacterized protein LOC143281738 [Babylonia areolata]|uniref:uncharacterized protein LOC143281738 n=1 Tax=Babylonia areolata TaxID=304850 RepID=UPI003FD3A5BD